MSRNRSMHVKIFCLAIEELKDIRCDQVVTILPLFVNTAALMRCENNNSQIIKHVVWSPLRDILAPDQSLHIFMTQNNSGCQLINNWATNLVFSISVESSSNAFSAILRATWCRISFLPLCVKRRYFTFTISLFCVDWFFLVHNNA